MNAWVLIAAALAGGAGAGLRYVLDALVTSLVFRGPPRPGRFPVAILLVNVTGSFALGVLTGLAARAGGDAVGMDVAWILGVGLLGGYTTFSTVSLDSVLLVRGPRPRRGWANALANLLLGVVAAFVGLALGGL